MVVTTVAVEAAPLPLVLPARGQVVGDHEARIAAGATGRVVDVLVERGSRVTAGAVIARLDTRLLASVRDEARGALAQAEANLVVTRDECARAEALFDKRLSDDAALLRARSACATAQAAADTAKARLSSADIRLADGQVRAQFPGVVVERLVSPGEYVREDTAIAVVVGTSNLRIELSIGERDASQIRGGESVRFRVAGDDQDRIAIIDRVSPSLGRQGRDLVVEASIQVAEGLRPGAFVDGGVEIGMSSAASVPEAAVWSDGVDTRAWVVIAGRAEERVISIGESQGGKLPILDGLAVGDRVVSPIPEGLQDGAAVQEHDNAMAR